MRTTQPSDIASPRFDSLEELLEHLTSIRSGVIEALEGFDEDTDKDLDAGRRLAERLRLLLRKKA